jgi:hypothetical protein
MIHGMMYLEKSASAVISFMVSVAALLSDNGPVIAKPTAKFSLALQSTPELNVRVFSFPGLSPWVLQAAESEAARMLRSLPAELKWIDCISRVLPAACMSPQLPTDLIVRFVAKALPNVSPKALGITDSSDSYAAAFIFFDRVVALRTHTRLVPVMLGRVMAHEIAHLLLPQQNHSDLGLMRGQWAEEDLRITSSTCLGLPRRSLHLMQNEAQRRVLNARGRVEK